MDDLILLVLFWTFVLVVAVTFNVGLRLAVGFKDQRIARFGVVLVLLAVALEVCALTRLFFGITG